MTADRIATACLALAVAGVGGALFHSGWWLLLCLPLIAGGALLGIVAAAISGRVR